MFGSPRAWFLLLAALALAGCVEPGEPRTTTRKTAVKASPAAAAPLISDARAGISFRGPAGLDLSAEHFAPGPPGQMRHRLSLSSRGTERLAVEVWRDPQSLPVGQWFARHLSFVRDGLEQVSWRNVSAHEVRGMVLRPPRSPQALGQRMAIFAHRGRVVRVVCQDEDHADALAAFQQVVSSITVGGAR